MMLGRAQLLPEVEALVSSGLECLLDESQERAVTVASVVQVAQDLRDVLEVCAAQLVSGASAEGRDRGLVALAFTILPGTR